MFHKTAVIGIGNLLLKDEGLGIHAVRLLKNRFPEINAEIIDAGTPGFGLYDLFEKYEKVVVVDAINMGKHFGSIGKFTPDQVVALTKSFSLHDLGLAEVIKLGQNLGQDFSHVIIWGIQPKEIAFGEDLTSEVKNSLIELVELIVDHVKASPTILRPEASDGSPSPSKMERALETA